MGEYADMMLDGTMCAGCGVFLGGDEGFPVYCRECKKDGHDPASYESDQGENKP